jgi:hypothetical protein
MFVYYIEFYHYGSNYDACTKEHEDGRLLTL